eukprot:evm.model.scf_868EXC.4 EVM.evm.TU.scf_868EXC.4   scf_868EXC:38965-41097(-)
MHSPALQSLWTSRRCAIQSLVVAFLALPAQESLAEGRISAALAHAFDRALAATDPDDADAAWGDAIRIDPANSAAWSNRGTARLQAGRWAEARDDLQRALELEGGGRVSGVLLNNLGNARAATGDWNAAMADFLAAAEDPDVGDIALANHALAAFQVDRVGQAVREVRGLLRRDPAFLDMRCALVAFLWACGRESDAEDEWEALQQAGDGAGELLYSSSNAVNRVRGRWPPRATAALDAFLKASRMGAALDYDGSKKEYDFSKGGVC